MRVTFENEETLSAIKPEEESYRVSTTRNRVFKLICDTRKEELAVLAVITHFTPEPGDKKAAD